MVRELKVIITDRNAMEEKITQIGGYFVAEKEFTDTYFKQPKGKVLKLSESKDSYELIELQEKAGKFEILKNERVLDYEKTKNDLAQQFGIKRVLHGKRRIFRYNLYTVTLNSIDNVGDFMILTGENPTETFLSVTFGLPNPEYIRVSFDELPNLAS